MSELYFVSHKLIGSVTLAGTESEARTQGDTAWRAKLSDDTFSSHPVEKPILWFEGPIRSKGVFVILVFDLSGVATRNRLFPPLSLTHGSRQTGTATTLSLRIKISEKTRLER